MVLSWYKEQLNLRMLIANMIVDGRMIKALSSELGSRLLTYIYLSRQNMETGGKSKGGQKIFYGGGSEGPETPQKIQNRRKNFGFLKVPPLGSLLA